MASAGVKKRIVCIGGGTGTFVVLRGLKDLAYKLSAIVSMSDSGGSNKRIRDEFGLLPTSDIRQCIVALSDETGGVGLLRKLFMYRFEKGEGISGMTFGNLFMAALTDILGSQEAAIRQTAKVLRINGTVIPVTYTPTDLFAEYEDGSVVSGEHFIDEPEHDGTLKITNLSLKPEAEANPAALEAIAKADLIVLGPGDLYTSLLPNLIVKGIGEAVAKSPAKKAFILNLMTRYGQTYNFKATDYVRTLEQYIGKSLNYVLINKSTLPKAVIKKYESMHEYPVVDDLEENSYYTVIREDLVSNQKVEQPKSDVLIRSLIRHDSEKLAKTLSTLVEV